MTLVASYSIYYFQGVRVVQGRDLELASSWIGYFHPIVAGKTIGLQPPSSRCYKI